jgi:outer membrane immunogenic protein
MTVARGLAVTKILCGAVLFGAVAFAAPALAADLSVKAPKVASPPAYSWTGFYVGGHVGYIWGATTVQDNGVVTDTNAPTNGVVGGVLAGAAWQNGPLVFGAEGDFGWSDAHGNGAAPIVTTTVIETPNTYKINSTSHVRGLLGYAAGQWLIFVAGGVAFSDFTFHDSQDIIERRLVGPGGVFTGGSIGGGIAYALTDRIAARAEYLFDDFGHKNYAGVDGDAYRVGLTGQTFRGAITLKPQ